METYVKRIDSFIDQLTQSNIKFLFFSCNKNRLRPHLTRSAKLFKFNGIEYYIIKGKDDGYFYTYTKSGLEYIVTHANNNVIGYEKTGGGKTKAFHGDHLTVGLDDNDGILLLDSHFTQYVEKKDPTEFKINRLYCLSEIKDTPLVPDTRCVYVINGRIRNTNETIGSVYAYELKEFTPLLIHYSDIIKGSHGGGGFVFNERRYKVYKNKKLESYIIVKRKRIYIDRQRGGASLVSYKGVTFNEQVAQFFCRVCLDKLMRQEPDFAGAEFVYDSECELGDLTNQWVAVNLFISDETRKLFFIEVFSLLKAYHASTAYTLTDDERLALEYYQKLQII